MTRWRGATVSLLAAGVWWVLAARTPTNTYHFAPLIVAAAWAAVEATSEAGLTPRMSVRLGIAGFLLASIVTVLIDAAGNLEGPVFWEESEDPPVVFEHLVGSALGALGGVAFAIRRAFRVAE
jgi:hypothetical protein